MARLEITKVVTGDKGEYRAVARNKHGEGVATINLNFDGSDKPKYINIQIFKYPFSLCLCRYSIIQRLSIFSMFEFCSVCLANKKWQTEFQMVNHLVSQKNRPFARMETF